jgi:hypothetical protein
MTIAFHSMYLIFTVMRPLLDEILHIFILAMMGGFLILLVSAAMGNSSVWSKRYIRDRRGRRISPNEFK